MNTWKRKMEAGVTHLAASDPILASVIKIGTLPDLHPHSDYYGALVSSIIGQQLSVKAAASIKSKFCQLFNSADLPTPEQILKKSVEELRSVGLSQAKANYVRDLALHVAENKLDFPAFNKMENQEIIQELVAVKGIGEWTAHMFLIFCMGRLDVLPVGDLGIKNGVKNLYDFKSIPSPEEIETLAKDNHWHPYESIASWYIWLSLENKPVN